MANQPNIPAHERRIHELDQNVERMFDVRKRLGKGAYGIVWKATDKRNKDTVALKKIFDAFRDETDAQRTYREVIFLRAFRHHPNIIRLMDVFKAGNNLDFYLVFEFMESDLHNVIKKGDVLKDIHKRFVMYQLINAIKYMHSGNVIHRDLKPSNILIDSKCRLKVADFGLARTLSTKRKAEFDDMDHEGMLTDYVATRWYRAPEILVASRNYTKGIDMWGLGCILGEMIRQKPLFQGTSTVNQIEKIVLALPDVTQRDIDSIGASFGTVLLSKKIHRDRRHSLDEMLRNCCDDAISLVKSLLVLNPHGRLTAKAAIQHPYVSRFRTASADMELRVDIHPPLKDDVRYGVDQYRSNLYDMIGRESRGSARTVSNATPSSNREISSTTTTKPQRVVSRTRTLSASQTDKKLELHPPPQPPQEVVSTLSRRIPEQKKPTTLQKPRPPSKDVVLPVNPPAPAGKSARNLAKCRHNRVVLQRELAAVKKSSITSTTTWQSQVQAQGKFHAEAKAHVQALLQSQMPLPSAAAGSPPEIQEVTTLRRNRSLRTKTTKEIKSRDKSSQSKGERDPPAEERRILEERRNLQRRRMADNLRLMEEEREQLEEMREQEAAAKAFSEIARKVKKLTQNSQTKKKREKDKKEREKQEEKEEKQEEEQEDIFCYRQRINHLEEEMAKCKEQLVNFVQDHQDLLTQERLRYHIKKLQPRKDRDEDQEKDQEENQEELFRREQERQRHRQLQEFLNRDDTNEFDLPDLANVYRASCFRSFNLQTPPPVAASGSCSSSSPASGRRESGESEQDYLFTSYFPNYRQEQKEREEREDLQEQRKRQERMKAQLKACQKQHDGLGLHHTVHHQRHHHLRQAAGGGGGGGPRYDPMRLRHHDIQEAKFSQGVN
nr:extracellular signal-regulated kinase 7 [Drosophila takahashii]